MGTTVTEVRLAVVTMVTFSVSLQRCCCYCTIHCAAATMMAVVVVGAVGEMLLVKSF